MPSIDLSSIKQQLKFLQSQAISRFRQNESIQSITKQFVNGVDQILIHLFHLYCKELEHQITLVAIGGYGRRELQLYSDIDLLLLYQKTLDDFSQQKIEYFIQACWDIGLEISHQLTTPQLCAELAEQDLSVISSLLDKRALCGSSTILEELSYLIHPLHIWSSKAFFISKQQEQIARYEKYDETAYNLQPNVKNGPGGLRDLHILFSIGKRHFNIKKLSDGITHGFFTDKEYEELIQCRKFLWKIRFALHWLAEKKEDRLLFDYQMKIAPLFGYQDTPEALAIEQFMKVYFKVIKRTRELNDIVLQWFAEAIVYPEKQLLISLDEDFRISNQYIEAKHPSLFKLNSEKLLTLFTWMSKLPEIQGVRANTIRLIHQHLYLINQNFRNNPKNTRQFIALFKTEHNPYDTLRHMNRYGVLGCYLQCFGKIIGQMQYDLFHVYTVDQHALFVIRNIARFFESEKIKSFPLCARLIRSLRRCEILYLAALFHDIAKGRGGDHSELGAKEAEDFSKSHQLDESDQKLLIWLVKNHLLMSHTAQRKDIYDPRTITEFCNQLPHSDYLDYLYLLTVADICATNPSLWNAWKDSLLKELYFAAKLALHHEETFLSHSALLQEKQSKALNLLVDQGLTKEQIQTLWNKFDDKYFIHESPAMIAKHTSAIIHSTAYPLVLILPHHSEGGIEVFIYMPHQDDRFSKTTITLSNHRVTIQEANILTCTHGFDLDTYIILNEKNHVFISEEKIQEIRQSLIQQLSVTHSFPQIINRRIKHNHAHFSFIPQISFLHEAETQYTRLFLIASDRPGLLAHISQIFLRQQIHVHHAKIATAGERVEDTFFITNQYHQPLSSNEQQQLKQSLTQALNHSYKIC